jgi:phytoene dehydrogenase-like protein
MIIIGAGISGLAAGIYARLNGYEVTIFEMHDRPGGLCTSWDRKGFTFDHCIHNLSGSTKRSPMNRVWQDLGALADTEILNHEEFVRVELPDGERFTFHPSIDRFEEEMLRLAPNDGKIIRSYMKGVRKLRSVSMEDLILGKVGKLRMLILLPIFLKWGRMSMEDFGAKFKDPRMQRIVPTLQYDAKETPALISMVFLGGLDRGDLGWPRGGSLAFARRMEERYLELEGNIEYRQKVLEIVVEDDAAVGVVTEDGMRYVADIIISAADGRSTLYSMLDGKYLDDSIKAYYADFPERQAFCLEVFLGIDEDLSREPHSLVMFLDSPITVEGVTYDHLDIEFFTHDSGLCSEGHSIIKVTMEGSYPYWKARKDAGEYDDEKRKVAETVISALATRFPWLRDHIEVTDVMTPLTVERYTGNFHGFQPWAVKDGSSVMKKGLSRTLPGLRNFHMVGQWALAFGGLNTVALRSRETIQRICREDRKRFIP